MQLTKERLERTATENQFMNGKIAAIDVSCLTEVTRPRSSFVFKSYRRLLNEALAKSFPETAEHLHPKQSIKEPQDT